MKICMNKVTMCGEDTRQVQTESQESKAMYLPLEKRASVAIAPFELLCTWNLCSKVSVQVASTTSTGFSCIWNTHWIGIRKQFGAESDLMECYSVISEIINVSEIKNALIHVIRICEDSVLESRLPGVGEKLSLTVSMFRALQDSCYARVFEALNSMTLNTLNDQTVPREHGRTCLDIKLHMSPNLDSVQPLIWSPLELS